MLDTIGEFLSKTLSPEKADNYFNALMALKRHGLDSAANEISLMFDEGSDKPMDMLLAGIEQIISVGQATIIAELGLVVDGNIAEKTAILEGLLDIEEYGDSAFVVSVIDNNAILTDVLCELLGFITLKDAEWFFPHIQEVDRNYIDKLYEIHRSVVDNSLSYGVVISPEAKLRCHRFMRLYKHTVLEALVTAEFLTPGMDKEIIVVKAKDAMQNYYPSAPNQAAIELVGLGLLIDFNVNEFVPSVKALINEFYQDPQYTTKVVFEVDKVCMESKLYEQI